MLYSPKMRILNPRVLSSIAAIAATCIVSVAAYYYKNRNPNEVMVFCKLQYNAHNYFDKLLSHIEAAKRSVHVCMPGIHNPAFQGCLVKLIKVKNIQVRIIIDKSGFKQSTNLFLKELLEAGAEIKYKEIQPSNRMLHKFCLIDDKILMIGTLNWGNDRSFDNWNYVYITTKKDLVTPIKTEFCNMWKHFSNDIEFMMNNEVVTDSDSETLETQFVQIIPEGKTNTDIIDTKLSFDTFAEVSVTPELYLM